MDVGYGKCEERLTAANSFVVNYYGIMELLWNYGITLPWKRNNPHEQCHLPVRGYFLVVNVH